MIYREIKQGNRQYWIMTQTCLWFAKLRLLNNGGWINEEGEWNEKLHKDISRGY